MANSAIYSQPFVGRLFERLFCFVVEMLTPFLKELMRRILIVDDAPDSSVPLARLLKRAGYDAHFAGSAAQAIAFVNSQPPDLVLLDIMMPEMSGFEVLDHIRSTSQIARIPVVIFTAVDEDSIRTEARLKGASDYWVKGDLDFAILRAGIESVIERTLRNEV